MITVPFEYTRTVLCKLCIVQSAEFENDAYLISRYYSYLEYSIAITKRTSILCACTWTEYGVAPPLGAPAPAGRQVQAVRALVSAEVPLRFLHGAFSAPSLLLISSSVHHIAVVSAQLPDVADVDNVHSYSHVSALVRIYSIISVS